MPLKSGFEPIEASIATVNDLLTLAVPTSGQAWKGLELSAWAPRAGLVLRSLCWLGAWLVAIYNRLVALRQRCGSRCPISTLPSNNVNDLVPNLVETIRGYAQRDKDTARGASCWCCPVPIASSRPMKPCDSGSASWRALEGPAMGFAAQDCFNLDAAQRQAAADAACEVLR